MVSKVLMTMLVAVMVVVTVMVEELMEQTVKAILLVITQYIGNESVTDNGVNGADSERCDDINAVICSSVKDSYGSLTVVLRVLAGMSPS